MRRATAVALLAVLSACSYFYRVTGRIAAEDGATGVGCAMEVFDGDIREDTCGGNPVPLGDRFLCSPSGNLDAVFDLRAACPGYVTLHVAVPVRSCAGSFFGGCEDIDLGSLVVRRAP